LFGKLFQDGEITDEAGLRARVTKDLEQMFERDADRLMTRKVYDSLISDVQITFPEAFLKRWIKLSATAPIADEDIEKEAMKHNAEYMSETFFEEGAKWLREIIKGNVL
jgi:trigger factor